MSAYNSDGHENGDQVAQASQMKPVFGPEDLEERRAHARLIAAAPELLKSLRLFMDIWNSGDAVRSSKRAQQRRADMWDQANAAIAKVEGRV